MADLLGRLRWPRRAAASERPGLLDHPVTEHPKVWTRTRCWLALIVAFGIALRAFFFVGLASGDPQDDGVYYGNALRLHNDGFAYLDAYRHRAPDPLFNPIDQFDVRPMVTHPIAALFSVFGPGEIVAASWSMVVSVLSLLVVYRLGAVVAGVDTGLVAAFLGAVYPLEVINGTRILGDAHIGFFAALATLALAEAVERRRPSLCLLAGVAAGGAYLANARGLVLLVAIAISAGALVLTRRLAPRAPLLVCAGFLLVFGPEAIAYYDSTGDPLLSYHIQSGAARYKYVNEMTGGFHWGPVVVEYTNGQPLEMTRTAFLLNHSEVNQLGVFFYVFAAAAAYCAMGPTRWLAILAAGLFLYFDFGPVQVSIDRAAGELHYMMVFKQVRFFTMLTAPLLVMSAILLARLWHRLPVPTLTLGALLLVNAVVTTASTHAFYRAGLLDLREAARVIEAMPDKTFVGDLWAILHLQIFTGHRRGQLVTFDPSTDSRALKNRCMMFGGSRGVELLAGYVESTLPLFIKQLAEGTPPPDDWVLIREVRGPRSAQRHTDFKIYCAS